MTEQNKRVDFDAEDSIPAEEYENLARKFIPGYDGLYSLSEVLLAENLPDKAKILVIGAGGGKELVAFGKAFPAATLTGVDPSEKMLGAAQDLIEKASLQSRVALRRGTIDDLEEEQYDAATALLVMHFLPDNGEKLRFLEAINRRLKTGAKLIIADGCMDKNAAGFERLVNAYKSHARLKGAPPEIIDEAAATVIERVNSIPENRELELLREANFGEVRKFFQGLWFNAWAAIKL